MMYSLSAGERQLFLVDRTHEQYPSVRTDRRTGKALLLARIAHYWALLLFLSPGAKSLSVSMGKKQHFVGFDLGTSGARISIIEKSAETPVSPSSAYDEIYSDSTAWDSDNPYDDARSWTMAIETLLTRASNGGLLAHVAAICPSGTSASCLLTDSKSAGSVTRAPRMYDYDVVSPKEGGEVNAHGMRAMELIDKYAPASHTARARTGSLAKLISWAEESTLQHGEVLSHQADFLSAFLRGEPKACGAGLQGNIRQVVSDWHNCLKLGYDVQKLEWPEWLLDCLLEGCNISDPASVLPSRVVAPGEVVGPVAQHLASKFGIPLDAVVVGGTTDSNAAFFAAVGGIHADFGTAVTSLGSTLAIKQLSRTYCEDAARGVYSHRFPVFEKDAGEGAAEEAWLVGGASNVGCAVLRQQHFSNNELVELSGDIDPNVDSPLRYYPLTKPGERFPVADSAKEPVLSPVPDSRRDYLHGILQGISWVERDGFEALGDMGASPRRPQVVWSCGGGARNDMWLQMRERILSEQDKTCEGSDVVKVRRAFNTEASFGAAILAAATF